MVRIYTLLFSLFLLVAHPLAAIVSGQQLANYMGTGSNPRLQLILASNGPNWNSYTIDYQQIGNVPWSSDSSENWSSWNVFDTATPPNYYGTITLTSDGSSVQWSDYVAGSNGYYLDGVNFSYNNGILAYQLTVNSVISPGGGGGGGEGPFPNAPLASPAVYPGTSQPITLQVNGDQIVTDQGDPVLLKGIVRPSLEWSPTGQYLSTQDLSNIANWKSNGSIARSNVIRLDLYQGYWLDSGPVTEMGSYKQIVNAIVYYSTQLGMAVILDLHWIVPGQQSPMADADSLTFWQQVATDYASFGTVLFELFNEPYGIDTNTWLNGGSYQGNSYVGYQQLYDAVRGTGAQNICIIGGLDYAYDLSFVNPSYKVNGTNIVYNSHPYNTKGQANYTGPGGTFQQNYQGIIGNFPLMFTEFGANSPSYYPTGFDSVYSGILNYANANNVHYSAFAWWVQIGDPAFPALIEDWDGTALYGGNNVHTDLIQHPGTFVEGVENAFRAFKSKRKLDSLNIKFNGSRLGPGTYCWDFGDASGQCTARPTISHLYPRPGAYAVRLTVLRQGLPALTVSKTIQVHSNAPPFVSTCSPRDARIMQVKCLNEVVNTITWKAPNPAEFCAAPAYYLVFRDQNLDSLVARVDVSDKNGKYKVKDKLSRKVKTTYSIIAVDQNGNRSSPVIAK